MENQTALAIAAHPDDIEFLMAGTLMRLKDAGFTLHYMNVANGCCGSTQHDPQTIAQIRRQEAIAAADKLGAQFHDSLCNDLEVFYEHGLLTRLAGVVREVRPSILLTHALSDYMEDHMNTARLAVTAAFTRGMPNYPVAPPAAPWSGEVTVYHAQPYTHHDPLGNLSLPRMYVDVTDLTDAKVELLACHASQKQWLDESQGVDSYLQALRDLDGELGGHSGRFGAAEGWTRHLPIGFCDPQADPLADVLRDFAAFR